MKNPVRHIGCPSCGGTLAFLEGERICVCPACGTRSIVEIEDHVPKYVLEPNMDEKAAKIAAQRLLSDNRLAPDVKKLARFYDAGLYYLPIYEFTSQRAGKFVTREIVKLQDGNFEKFQANVLLRDIHHQAPAVKLGDWGIENIHLEKLRQLKAIKPYDPAKLEKKALVFDATIRPGSTDLETQSLSQTFPGDETKLLRKRLRLVYCPVWLIKYTYRNRLYRLVFDAITEQILFGRAPARDTERIPLMVACLAFFTFPISRIIRSFFVGSVQQMGQIFVLLSIPLFLVFTFAVSIFSLAWNQFRYSGELVWRGETAAIERVNEPPVTGLERFARLLMSVVEEALSGIKVETKANRWYGQW